MLSLADRVKERLEAVGLSGREASIAAGLSETYVRDILNGKSARPSGVGIAKLAPVLKTTSAYLLEGTGDAEAQPIPIKSYIGAGAAIVPFEDQGPLEWVEAPPGAVGVVGAAIVRGTSQLPALREGDLVFWGEGSEPSAYIGLECVCTLADGRVMVKTILPGRSPKTYTLISHNDAPIHDAAIVSASPVLWVKRSLQR